MAAVLGEWSGSVRIVCCESSNAPGLEPNDEIGDAAADEDRLVTFRSICCYISTPIQP
jgi:hypothetical protein